MRLDLVAGAAAAAWFGPAAAPVVRPVAAAFRIPCKLPAGTGVALTFDDGPHSHGTPAVLEALAARRAVATFFLVGEQVERHWTLAAEIVAAGHAIGIHGYRHTLLLRRPPGAVRDDLRRARDVIGSVTGTGSGAGFVSQSSFSSASLRRSFHRSQTCCLSRSTVMPMR